MQTPTPTRPVPRRAGLRDVNGTELWFEVHGEGPPLVLIEGLGSATWLWDPHLPAFADHFTTVVWDLRGSGRSAKPAGPYTVALLAADLAGLMESLEIERAHVLGVSLGGFIAQEFALTWPERVDRLVLACTSMGGAAHVPMSPEAIALFMDATGTPREALRRKFPLAFTETWLADSARVERMLDLRMENPQPAHAFQAQAVAGATFDAAERVSGITAPTLVLAGGADVMVPVQNAHRLAAAIPKARLRVWEGLGHQFFVEAPDEFTNEVISFLHPDARDEA